MTIAAAVAARTKAATLCGSDRAPSAPIQRRVSVAATNPMHPPAPTGSTQASAVRRPTKPAAAPDPARPSSTAPISSIPASVEASLGAAPAGSTTTLHGTPKTPR